jgi:hypothetical protein
VDFKHSYPDFAAIEEHIKRARLERSLAIAHFIADLAAGAIRGVKRLVRSIDTFRRGAALPHWARHDPAPR